jgi:hypothetical protein
VKLLLDEMHAPSVAVDLAGEAFDIVAVAAQPELRGMADDELLAYAATERRALVTQNVADFMALATQWAGEHKRHAGLIFTNQMRFNRSTLAYPGNLITSLREFLTHPPKGESWIWWL